MNSVNNEPAWGALILSNVLLTSLVTFSFLVVGWLAGTWIASGIFSDYSFFMNDQPSLPALRNAFVFYATAAGFIVSQLCFALQFSQRGEQPWPVLPFSPRVHLLSLILAVLAAAGLLLANVSATVEDSTFQSISTTGWPLIYQQVTTEKHIIPTVTANPPREVLKMGSAIFDIFACLDLIFLLLVFVELFLSRDERRARGSAIPRLPDAPVSPQSFTPSTVAQSETV